jgi:anti-sigma regulatory factor (Ser/Thr protein kinase)
MEISLDLRLPRDVASVPAARRLLDSSLAALGVDATIRDDIELMLTEACTNAIRHAGFGEEYTVRVGIQDELCVIKVIDSGRGFGTGERGEGAGPVAEYGRGLLLMRALADTVRFGSVYQHGALVALEKHLRYRRNSLGSRLADHGYPYDGPMSGSNLRVMNEADPELREFATRLFDLARSGQTERLAAYVDAGVPVNLTNDKGDTLLMLAAYHGHAETVRALVARGADPERTNDRGQRPLAGAVFKQESEVVRALLDAGADPRAGRPSAIETARMFDQTEFLAWFDEATAC